MRSREKAGPVAPVRAISRPFGHILAERQIAKEEFNMICKTAGGGDVDDLIFQDSWSASQR